MKLFVASDHAAYEAKNKLVDFLAQEHEVVDLGTNSPDSTDYPKWAIELVKYVKKEKILGILLCGSGIGVSMVANRFKGIRAALCRDEDDAIMARKHNDANVLCLSGRKTSYEELVKIAQAFLTHTFDGGRHKRRIDLFDQIGED